MPTREGENNNKEEQVFPRDEVYTNEEGDPKRGVVKLRVCGGAEKKKKEKKETKKISRARSHQPPPPPPPHHSPCK